MPPEPSQPSSDVLIVGAGVAGATTARVLADQGQQVTVLDSAEQPGSGASGNPQGAVYIRPGLKDTPETRFSLTALDAALRSYEHWQADSERSFWFPSGLLHLAWNESEQRRLARFQDEPDYSSSLFAPITAAEARSLAGQALDQGGLWFPSSGWIRPDLLCRVLLDHPRIHWHGDTNICALTRSSGSTSWRVTDSSGRSWLAPHILLAAAEGIQKLLPPELKLPLKEIRGQVSIIEAQPSASSDIVLCADGYALPQLGTQQLIGATFDINDDDRRVRDRSHQENRDRLLRWYPAAESLWPQTASVSGRVAFRVSTPDYLPVAGALWQPQPLRALVKDAPKSQRFAGNTAHREPGLYVLTGLGSKGLAYAPILAQHLAALIMEYPSPLPPELAERVWPARFEARAIRRRARTAAK